MKTLVVYDSVYGNTEAIAKAIAGAMGEYGQVELRKPAELHPARLPAADLLIVGSPTVGGRATPAVQAFVTGIPASALSAVRLATFDTRMEMLIARLFGYAAPRIQAVLEDRGGIAAASPEGFIVQGREGPLRDGETERAATWARGLAQVSDSPGAERSRRPTPR
jgi:flavodoxin